ncbi:MAG: discoidin domain-containing protein [Opitutaceae bacterium]
MRPFNAIPVWLVAVASVFAETAPSQAVSLPARAAGASSTLAPFAATRAVDGDTAADSRWSAASADAPAWLELDLGAEAVLSGLHLFSGADLATTPRDFSVQFWRAGAWQDIPSARVTGNAARDLALGFDEAVVVRTTRIRISITATHGGPAAIREVRLWPAASGGMPSLVPAIDAGIPKIYLNQSGFNLGKPKRFTAPTLPDGTLFEIRGAGEAAALFRGVITGQIGDFSAFNPDDPAGRREYVVVAGPFSSVPFRIGWWWLERVSYQGAVDFMIDSRHYVGNHRAVCRGSFGWRDDHHFGWELHTLVPQFLSNPSAYTRMPRQIVDERPTDPKLWGALVPCRADAPDLVKLIHWGADIIVTQRLGHEHLKAQLAYFLYAWPWLKPYLDEQNYAAVRDYTFATWTTAQADRTYPYDESPEHDLLALKVKVGTTKGAYPPGFSIEPNLLLYAVALREQRSDAERYFESAHRQAEWLIAHLDWNDPLVTKGQRMSEWLTLTGLAHFLQVYPDRAPAGLAAKIEAWAEVVVRRSANLWDFRKLTDGDGWTPMGDKPTMWNEPGNVVGLPAALLAARPFVRDAATRARLEELAYAHFDACFGRNPAGRHFSYDAPREVEGVEHGWYSFHKGGIGQLAGARFVIDGSPKNQHFPYHPEVGNIGWTEGWVTFNTAYNRSLASLAYAETAITLQREGESVVVRLAAPLNFDEAKAETAEVMLSMGTAPASVVVLTEDSANARTFSARIPLAGRAPRTIEASYGFGAFAHHATLTP